MLPSGQGGGCSQNTPIFLILRHLQHVRTYVSIYHISSKHPLQFLPISLAGFTTLSMTYNINVRPYNDPEIKDCGRSGWDCCRGLDLLVLSSWISSWSIFPIWCSQLQKNWWYVTFAGFYRNTWRCVLRPAVAYDPSFVTEALEEIEYSSPRRWSVERCCCPGIYRLHW